MQCTETEHSDCKRCGGPNKWLAGDLCVDCFDRDTEDRILDILHQRTQRLDLATRLLCELCTAMERGKHIKFCYEQLHPATELAKWWEEQKKLDAEREKK